MVLDILGVIKRLFTLSSYNLTFQLIILNLIIVFLGLVFLSYFNFNLIQNSYDFVGIDGNFACACQDSQI